jgi:hypothetical protein
MDELGKYHQERLSQQITVTCDKCPVPMLWLDTAIYIDLAKNEVGERTHSDPRHNLLTTLREIVLRKVEEGSLSTPKVNGPRRSRESEGERLGERMRCPLRSQHRGEGRTTSCNMADRYLCDIV